MMKSGSAAYSQGKSAGPFADTAANVFQHLGEASQRLMELQAQAAAIVLMDSAARYAEVMEGVLRDFGVPQWMEAQRSQMRGAAGPLQAWMEAAAGLQAVLAAAFLQALALTVFPAPAGRENPPSAERRVNSVVIQFPDRRRGRTS